MTHGDAPARVTTHSFSPNPDPRPPRPRVLPRTVAGMGRPFVSRPGVARALLTAAFAFGMAAPLGLTVAVADRVLVWSLYGPEAVRRQSLHVASHVPMRISNGDRIREFNGFLHFVGAVGGWLVLAVVALFVIRRLLPRDYRRLLDRMGAPRGSNPDPSVRRRGRRWVTFATLVLAAALLAAQQAVVLAALSALAIAAAHFVPLAGEPAPRTPNPAAG